MAYNQAALDAQLTAIQAAITTALANPRPNWSVGHVKMDQNSYLSMLFEQQMELIKLMKEIPSEVITTTHNEVNDFGQDLTQFHDEPVI